MTDRRGCGYWSGDESEKIRSREKCKIYSEEKSPVMVCLKNRLLA